jgi:hypothetical protein
MSFLSNLWYRDQLAERTLILSNKNNSPTNNPPGYSVWVGGKKRGDVASGAVKLEKLDDNVELKITPDVLVNGELLTWYYNYGWYSGPNIKGPFENGQEIDIPKIEGEAKVEKSFLDEFDERLKKIETIESDAMKTIKGFVRAENAMDRLLCKLKSLEYRVKQLEIVSGL